jgi:hypothetical protein
MTMNLASVALPRIGGWIARLILVLAIALEIHTWLDVFVFQPEEYERLIGGESGCVKFKSFCSWPAFVLDQVPFTILSILAAIALLWRRLPILGALTVLVIAYLGWRFHRIRVEALSEYCCYYRAPTRVTMQLELLSPN